MSVNVLVYSNLQVNKGVFDAVFLYKTHKRACLLVNGVLSRGLEGGSVQANKHVLRKLHQSHVLLYFLN